MTDKDKKEKDKEKDKEIQQHQQRAKPWVYPKPRVVRSCYSVVCFGEIKASAVYGLALSARSPASLMLKDPALPENAMLPEALKVARKLYANLEKLAEAAKQQAAENPEDGAV